MRRACWTCRAARARSSSDVDASMSAASEPKPCSSAGSASRAPARQRDAHVVTGEGETPWIALDRLGAYLPAAAIAAEDQRFFEHAGVDATELTALFADLDGAPRARREHIDATAGAHAVHRRRTDCRPQAARASLRARDGAHARQGTHPRALSQHGALGPRDLRGARGGAQLLQQESCQADPDRSGLVGRDPAPSKSGLHGTVRHPLTGARACGLGGGSDADVSAWRAPALGVGSTYLRSAKVGRASQSKDDERRLGACQRAARDAPSR